MTTEIPAETPLHVLHLELEAKMVFFAGYDIPVQHPVGVLREHLHTYERAGLFGISYMGQIRLVGADAALILESLVLVDVLDLPVGQQRYVLLTDEQGGILDDLMVTNLSDCLLLVVNAAYKRQDPAYLRRHLGGRCSIEPLFEERALFALQGLATVRVPGRLALQVAQMTFIQFTHVGLLGQGCYVDRSGYTGEDGCETSVPAAHAEILARRPSAEPEVASIGLGACDSPRLETDLCLCGHDTNSTTTPVEVSLGWAISRARRVGGVRAGGFPGAERVFAQQAQGVTSKHAGFLPQGRMPVCEDIEIVDTRGRAIGKTSSGGLGLGLSTPLAMDYVPDELAGLGSEVTVMVYGRPTTLVVSKMSFVVQCHCRG